MNIFDVPDLARAVMNFLSDVRRLHLNHALDAVVRSHPEYAMWTKIHSRRSAYAYGLPKMITGDPRKQDITNAFAKGNIPMIEHLAGLGVKFICAIIVCVRGNQLSAIKYLVDRGHEVTTHAFYVAIKCSRVTMLDYLFKLHKPVMFELMEQAICYRRTSVVKYLVERGATITAGIVDRATRRGCVKVLKYLLEMSQIRPSGEALFDACACGNVKVIKLIQPPNPQRYFVEACKCNHIGIVRYLFTRVDYPEEGLIAACERNSVKVIKYLTAQGVKTDYSLERACVRGSLDIVKILAESATGEMIHAAICAAKSRGHLAVVEYLSAL